jgi:hypothetical protein
MTFPSIRALLAPAVLLLSAGSCGIGMGKLDIGDFMVEYGPADHNGSSFVELEMYTAAGDLVR